MLVLRAFALLVIAAFDFTVCWFAITLFERDEDGGAHFAGALLMIVAIALAAECYWGFRDTVRAAQAPPKD